MRPMSYVVMLAGGALFGFGLALSTMIQPGVVLSFLRLEDFGLLLVLGGAVGVTAITYQLAPRVMRKPLLESEFEKKAPPLSLRTLGGAALFGIGWGLSGVCPGPAIAGLGAGNLMLLVAVFGIALGAYVQGATARR